MFLALFLQQALRFNLAQELLKRLYAFLTYSVSMTTAIGKMFCDTIARQIVFLSVLYKPAQTFHKSAHKGRAVMHQQRAYRLIGLLTNWNALISALRLGKLLALLLHRCIRASLLCMCNSVENAHQQIQMLVSRETITLAFLRQPVFSRWN